MVKQEWFQRDTPGAEPRRFDLVIQSWDTANKDTELADPSVCTTWGKRGNRIYLLNVYCRRVDYPDLKRLSKNKERDFPAIKITLASNNALIKANPTASALVFSHPAFSGLFDCDGLMGTGIRPTPARNCQMSVIAGSRQEFNRV